MNGPKVNQCSGVALSKIWLYAGISGIRHDWGLVHKVSDLMLMGAERNQQERL